MSCSAKSEEADYRAFFCYLLLSGWKINLGRVRGKVVFYRLNVALVFKIARIVAIALEVMVSERQCYELPNTGWELIPNLKMALRGILRRDSD